MEAKTDWRSGSTARCSSNWRRPPVARDWSQAQGIGRRHALVLERRDRGVGRCWDWAATAMTVASRCSRQSQAACGQQAAFTYMTNESDALAKIAGQRPIVPSVRRVGEVLRDEWAGAAVGYVADLELQAPEPVHGQGGQYGGKQYGIRTTGLDAIPLPLGQGDAEGALVSLIFDDRYKGKISCSTIEHAHGRRGLPRVQGCVEPERRRAEAVQQLLIEKKKNVRLIWSSETNSGRRSGRATLMRTHGRDWVQMKKKGLKVV